MRETPRRGAIVCALATLTMIGACSNSDDGAERSTPASQSDLTAPATGETSVTTDTSDTTPASTGDRAVTTVRGNPASTTTEAPAVGTTVPDPSDGPAIDVDALLGNVEAYLDSAVNVRGRSFFLESCPPPGSVPTTPCTLTMYLIDLSRTDLLYGERDQAIPVAQGRKRISCVASGGVRSCTGWEHGIEYVLSGRVIGQPRPGGVELDIGT